MAIFELFVSYGMIGIFAIGILSSIIPIPKEPVVLGLLDIGENPELVFIVLITGSIMGASLGYLAGKYELRGIGIIYLSIKVIYWWALFMKSVRMLFI
jgi:membrane protein YqaA with SNARE-associated domain